MDFQRLTKLIQDNNEYSDWEIDGDLYETFPWIVDLQEQYSNVPGLEFSYDAYENVLAVSFYICPASYNNFAVIAITNTLFPDVKYGWHIGGEGKTNPRTGKSGEVGIVFDDQRKYYVAEMSITDASSVPINKMDHIIKQFLEKAKTLQRKMNKR